MIYTSYFYKQTEMKIEDCAYISIAVGNPKYEVPYSIVDCKVLKPYGIFRVYSGEAYRQKYFERLDSYGVDRIRREIARAQGDHKNAVLMCHERNKLECHRSMFAEWWQARTGEVIPEYDEENIVVKEKQAKPEKKPEKKVDAKEFENKQLTMFGILGI